MASFASAGLRRRLADLTAATRAKVKHRLDLRERARAEASIAAALACLAKTGAGNAAAERGIPSHYHGATRRLANLGDSAALRRADAAFIAADPELAAREAKEAVRLTDRTALYTTGAPPPEPGAAPFSWYAWSLAQGQGPTASDTAEAHSADTG